MENGISEHPDCHFNLSFEDGKDVQIYGCERVLIYEDDCVLIRLSGCNLRIVGSKLTLRGYFGREIAIGGRIDLLGLEAI